jgi:hypothetical protein
VRLVATSLFLLAAAARAEEPDVVVRPLVGVSARLSDSGAGFGAQVGIRLSPLLLRLSFTSVGA